WPGSTCPTQTDAALHPSARLGAPGPPSSAHHGTLDTATAEEDRMKVGVLGAGVMGAGIAQITATAGHETVCYDVDAAALASGAEHVTTGRYGFERGVERGKLTREEADAARARLSFTSSFDEAAQVDVVIEAVPEKLELKQQVFRDLDAAAPAGTILASNTSGFPIGQIAGATKR